MLSYLSVTILKTFFNSEYLISLIFAATCTTRNCIYTWQKYAQLRDFDIGWRFSRKMKSFQKWCWLTTSSPILSTVTLNWNSLFDKSFTLCFNRNFSFWLLLTTSFSCRSILVADTVTTLWSSSWPRNIISRTWEPSTVLTDSHRVSWCLVVILGRLGRWSSRSETDKSSRSTSAELRESFQSKLQHSSYCLENISIKIIWVKNIFTKKKYFTKNYFSQKYSFKKLIEWIWEKIISEARRSVVSQWRWWATRSECARCLVTGRSAGQSLRGWVSMGARVWWSADPSQVGCTRSGFICNTWVRKVISTDVATPSCSDAITSLSALFLFSHCTNYRDIKHLPAAFIMAILLPGKLI